MGTLYLVGMGLWDENDMTRRAVSLAASCGSVFMEDYTSRLMGADHMDISRALGRKVELLDRVKVEDGSVILDAASDGEAALLVGGDPGFATTHSEIAIRAKRAGIEVRWIHAPSIFSAAAALTGLSPYKFGRTTTLVSQRGDYLPQSPLDFIGENLEMGLHTLILLELDMDEDPPRYMLIPDALAVLERLQKRKGTDILTPVRILCGIARAGSTDPMVRCGTLRELSDVDWGGPLHTLVLPGKLHFMERQGLVVLAGGPEHLLEDD